MKIPVVLLFLLVVFLVPNPVVPDEALAADVEAETPGGPSAQQQQEEEGEPLETFVPSEKVSADRSISFPVDI
jgi:hypothetical protein